MKRFENLNLEYKREYTEQIRKAVIAFANTDGGAVLVGVDDDGTVRGVDDVDGTRVRVGNLIRDSIRPDVRAFVSVTEEERGGRTVLRFDVQRGTARPYYWKAKGLRPEGVFVRQDAASVPASEAAIREMLLASADGAFERMRSLRQDLTFGAAAAFFRERKVAFGPAQRRSLGLVGEDGLFTNLALLLSDQCPFTLKLAVFEGTGKTVFRERREIGGSVLAQVREAFDYLDKWNRTRAEVRGLDRVDRRDYPPEAVREALLNAVVHRDYALPGADLVSLFDDRLEVLSAGGLVRGVSLSDVLLGLSALRNAALAGVFYRLRLIEAYGTGLLKIREAYAGSPRPAAVEATDHAFKVTLPNRNAAVAAEPRRAAGSA
ncbi:MAG: putative DNA binding domain-containing protein, partial [Kiritimatiellae bacterium]|nr:putative DNA binding domain-containing protein [Kiritimatiellia bacterium]